MSRRSAVLFCLLALVPAVLVGCGGDKVVTQTGANGQVTTRTVPDVKFAKTKFVLHSGLAFGALRRYVYKPYKAGTFKKGADGRTAAFVKAAAATAFAINEIRLARNAALSDDQLRAVGDKLGGLGAKLTALVAGLKAGDAAGIGSSLGDLSSIQGLAKAAGVDIPIPTSIPGL